MSARSTGLPDRRHHQRQHQLLPHVQEDVPAPPRHDGPEPRRPARPRGLRPAVQLRLPQRFTAHVRLNPRREPSDCCRGFIHTDLIHVGQSRQTQG